MTTVLVLGATGKVGRHLVSGLLEQGIAVRALTRDPMTAALPDEVDVVTGDVAKPDTIEAAARGTDSAFLLWPGFDPSGAKEAVAALAANVRHIVQLSSARLQGQDEGVTEGVWSEVESHVAASGVAWTFVRAGGFAANTLSWADTIRAGDVLRVAFPQAARSVVHERDIADVAVRALVDPGHEGLAYAVTGPEVLSQADQAAIIGEVIGRPVVVDEKPSDDARREFASFMGPDGADRAIAHWATLVDSPERATGDVERVTGHPARTYAEWVRDHRDAFTPSLTSARAGTSRSEAP
jgi:uncharacterized protein YbjT (DUF2867 family)